MLSDSHMHLDGCPPNELKGFVEEAKRRGVAVMVGAAMDLESAAETIAIGEAYDVAYPAVGIHPWNAIRVDEEVYGKLRELASRKGVVAISEIGLDFIRNPATIEVQKQAFAEHVRLAKESGLPMIIHCREAHAEMMDILKRYRAWETGGAIHGFSGDDTMLRDWLDLGFYISVGRAITRPEMANLQEVVKGIPPDRLLIETDSSPRARPDGTRVQPAAVGEVAERLAELKGLTAAEIGDITLANLERLLKIS
jgi:TatD DNase family protein